MPCSGPRKVTKEAFASAKSQPSNRFASAALEEIMLMLKIAFVSSMAADSYDGAD